MNRSLVLAALLLCGCPPKPAPPTATGTAPPPGPAPPAGTAPAPPAETRKGVDGYITGSAGQFAITFADDGIPGNGGFCCGATVADTRKSYPSKNLIALPGAGKLAPGVLPPLVGVDGLIVATGDGRFKVDFATDGVRSGGGFCCAATVDAARDAYSNKNLAYLP